MKLCISQATTLSAAFADDLSAFADVGWTAVELWLTKLEKHLETSTIDATRQLFQDKKILPVAAAYQGGLLLSQGEQRKAHFDHFRRRLELCQALGIPTMLLVADFVAALGDAGRYAASGGLQRAVVSLTQAAQWAAAFDVRLALEFRGSDAFCTNLESALGLVGQCGEPNVGLCLDLFHYYKGPSKTEDLAGLTRANLAHVQFCDMAGVPRELMTDADRVLPGDGDFHFGPIVEMLKRIGYQGYVSLEVMNPVFWQMKLTQVAELGLMALRRVID
ncbi:MAG TPA: sugar phosphate isomerase/epimerase [Gemmataceae bacterium]|jgi:sugar phosphate isomerase/epimerase|nr:sugar phosphate isomerase/epimerase [Gemmataceae bacterium]